MVFNVHAFTIFYPTGPASITSFCLHLHLPCIDSRPTFALIYLHLSTHLSQHSICVHNPSSHSFLSAVFPHCFNSIAYVCQLFQTLSSHRMYIFISLALFTTCRRTV
ncbi:hypothetical protein BOTBODRAFT_456819 [Botryobasidium botryosum FD-172 SS1]|uniref:Uncharacterized protein n=1 Tax=Botryobasidium botryosum (strain FD-172 SS1) TaxID=930990 RepID=A0A067MHX6_BOTB1|nr:hypothetical protein BOTBODRAFT_456819 [Botryobasidium botryosum FD-172 SS1]